MDSSWVALLESLCKTMCDIESAFQPTNLIITTSAIRHQGARASSFTLLCHLISNCDMPINLVAVSLQGRNYTMERTEFDYILKMNEQIWLDSLSERHYNLKLLFDFDTSPEDAFVFLYK